MSDTRIEPRPENKMGVMPVNKLLISMAVPMMISMLVQALSVASMTFYPFVIVCQTPFKENVQEGVMLIVLSSAVSLLMNTASPVVWSVFTPLFLFTCVLWFVVFLCFSVC